jgi:hypothetical protein
LIYSSILPKPGIQVTPLVTIQVSKHLYVFQNTVLFFVIYNAVELYPETDNTLGICNVFAVGNNRMCFH